MGAVHGRRSRASGLSNPVVPTPAWAGRRAPHPRRLVARATAVGGTLLTDPVYANGRDRQAARLQPAASYRDGVLDVFWETPKDQVLRFVVTGERAQAVMRGALALLPDPAQAVCPVDQSLPHWLRHVYRLLREVGRIGVPGEPTLAALKDPAAPTPVVLPRETWLLERAGLAQPGRRS